MADFKDMLTNTADHTAEYEPSDIEQNKVMAILAYLSWLVLIPLFAAKESRFARFHCNQGIVLAIVEIVIWVAFGILGNLPLIGWIFTVLEWLISLVCFAMAIIGIIHAVNGKAKELPFIGGIKILK